MKLASFEAIVKTLIRFVRIETLIRMKKLADREKDREDIRQLKILLENPDND